jgi:hypothetical protein
VVSAAGHVSREFLVRNDDLDGTGRVTVVAERAVPARFVALGIAEYHQLPLHCEDEETRIKTRLEYWTGLSSCGKILASIVDHDFFFVAHCKFNS